MSCTYLADSLALTLWQHPQSVQFGGANDRARNADASSELAGRWVSLPSFDFVSGAPVHCAFWKNLKSSASMSSPSILCGLGARIRSIMPVNADRLHAAMNAILDPADLLVATAPLTKQIYKRAAEP